MEIVILITKIIFVISLFAGIFAGLINVITEDNKTTVNLLYKHSKLYKFLVDCKYNILPICVLLTMNPASAMLLFILCLILLLVFPNIFLFIIYQVDISFILMYWACGTLVGVLIGDIIRYFIIKKCKKREKIKENTDILI